MTDLRTAAQQALEALEDVKRRGRWGDFDNLTGTLRAALEADDGMYGAKALTKAYENGWNAAKAEPVQEPVALNDGRLWQYFDGSIGIESAPPQRKPLTGEEILSLFRTSGSPTAFARAIERAHGIAE